MTTTSFSKAIRNLYFTESTSTVTISWKEVIGNELVTKKSEMKAWEALNLLENINRIAFVRLTAK